MGGKCLITEAGAGNQNLMVRGASRASMALTRP